MPLPSLDATVHAYPTLDVSALRDELCKNGAAIVQVYDPQDAEDASIVAEYAVGIDNVAARVRDAGKTPHGAKGIGIVKNYGFGCQEEVWSARTDGRVRRVFALLAGAEPAEMAVGCDAVAYLGPDAARANMSANKAQLSPRNAFFDKTGGKLDLHIDICPSGSSPGNEAERKMAELHPQMPYCVQGQLTLRAVERGGPALVVVPGAHKALKPAHFNAGRDFATCTDDGYARYAGQHRAVDGLRPGALVLWLSRLPHANKLADAGCNPRRSAVFLSWQHRAIGGDSTQQQEMKKRKLDCILGGGTTDHWAHVVPKKGRGSRGDHYSNGKKGEARNPHPSRVLPPPAYTEAMLERIKEAL
jgi:hypothetical protein